MKNNYKREADKFLIANPGKSITRYDVAVLIGAIIMMYVDAPIIDPILSLLIALFVLFNMYRV